MRIISGINSRMSCQTTVRIAENRYSHSVRQRLGIDTSGVQLGMEFVYYTLFLYQIIQILQDDGFVRDLGVRVRVRLRVCT